MFSFDKNITCCFTGHRPSKLPCGGRRYSREIEVLYRMLNYEIRYAHSKGFVNFVSGMAQGFDMLAAECVLQNAKELGIRLVCAIPSINQTDKWTEQWRKKYDALVDDSSIIVYTEYEYTKNSYMKRNRYMVDNSGLVIACYNQDSADYRSGTGATVRYAQKNGVPVVNLWNCWKVSPDERIVRFL